MANCIWISVTGGSWSTGSNWSTGLQPAANDVVKFGNGAGATQTNCSIDVNTNVVTTVNCTGYTGTITHGAGLTLNLGGGTAGSLTFVAGMTYTLSDPNTSAINFAHTVSGNSVTTGGKTLGNVTFNGASGVWTLQDSFTTGTSSTVNLTAGTLDTNGKTCSWGLFNSSNTNTRTLTLGASAITITGNNSPVWTMVTITGLTFNANTSTITTTGNGNFTIGGGSLTYNNFTITGTGACTISGTNTFANLNRSVASSSATVLDSFTLGASQTVTGVFTASGFAQNNRLVVISNTLGNSRSIALSGSATATLTNVDFSDTTFTGTNTPVSGTSVGDGGNNSGITFTGATTRYWVGNSGNMTDNTNHWAASSGGSPGATFPLPHDNIVFNANSFSSGSQAVTNNCFFVGKDITWTGVTNTPAWDFNAGTATTGVVFGSLTLTSGMTITASATNSIAMRGRSASTLTTAGTNVGILTIQVAASTLTLQDTLNATSVNVQVGTFNSNNLALNLSTSFTSLGALTRTVTISNSIINLSATSGTIWNAVSGGLTLNAGGSTIAISAASSSSRTFTGGGLTYGSLAYTVPGSTGALVIGGANTFNAILFSDPTSARTLTLPASTTTTVTGGFNVNGLPGILMTLNSSTGATAATISKASGTVACDYLSIQDSTATGGATWSAGTHSTNVSGNTGWSFTVATVARRSLTTTGIGA